ncbi:aminotransferase class III-fold pyridoxal phosphate-dependent enzyme [Thiomonas sp. SCN 64-16]|uniref:aminotransferase class III-fold pyridoxal phosphate-dependent enzyme n=1 Tax=Thiomonas sp. SCN 64-16 TaxID=1660151 RepID=UPI00257FD5A6|nr:aminotransferase class III-fold pyridoxal phosphate-dependent enzyme [Thiomonas sp. SCN 64-16]
MGHGHPGMQQAMAEAGQRGLVASPTAAFPDKARAGQLLAEITPPGLNKSFLCLSGAEANENALKMARMVTGRNKVVARTRSYHGATLAMLSLSGDPRRELFEPGLPGIVRFTDPYCYRCKFDLDPNTCSRECAQDLETSLLEAGPETVAAVFVEGDVIVIDRSPVGPPSNPAAVHSRCRCCPRKSMNTRSLGTMCRFVAQRI